MVEIIIPNRRHERIISRLESNPEGISLLPNGSVPDLKGGFIVSVTNNVVDEISPSVIDKVWSQLRRSQLATLVGGWFSDKKRQFFIDASAVVPDLNQALALANMYNQEAIFDVAKNKCIYMNGAVAA